MRLSDTIYRMMDDARQRVIETMRERDIKVVNLVMTPEEFAEENGFDDVEQAESDYYDYRNTEAPYVIFFDKWGNGIDYAALSVELVDGEHPKFKLNCYNSNEGDDRFYDNDLTQLSMVNVYERMLEELEIKDEPEKKDDEMEVLVAYDYEDGSRHNLATMKSSDWTGSKTEAMHKFLQEHYEAWLDGCDDKERDEYLEEIKEAADLLSVGTSADCCGDNLYWETVTNI